MDIFKKIEKKFRTLAPYEESLFYGEKFYGYLTTVLTVPH